MSDMMMSEYDPYLLAAMVGQEYNPYQGYPLKQVSDQIWDVYGPTPDYLIAQQFGMMTPNREDFSLDAFFAADPMLRGPMAEALDNAGGDTIGAYNYLQGDEFQDRLREQVGRTEWDQLVGQGDLRSIAAITPEERDEAAIDYYMRGLEGLMAGGAPTSQAMQQQYDMIAERMGGMPYPGAGQTDLGFGGAGFEGGGGMDPLAALAGAGAQEPEQGVNLDARPEGTPFGAGIQDVGAAGPAEGEGAAPMGAVTDGKDKLFWQDGVQYAEIGGRRYALPSTMERSGGRMNPEYMRALNSVMTDRRRREFEMSGEHRRRSGNGPDRSALGELWRTIMGSGTLISGGG